MRIYTTIGDFMLEANTYAPAAQTPEALVTALEAHCPGYDPFGSGDKYPLIWRGSENITGPPAVFATPGPRTSGYNNDSIYNVLIDAGSTGKLPRRLHALIATTGLGRATVYGKSLANLYLVVPKAGVLVGACDAFDVQASVSDAIQAAGLVDLVHASKGISQLLTYARGLRWFSDDITTDDAMQAACRKVDQIRLGIYGAFKAMDDMTPEEAKGYKSSFEAELPEYDGSSMLGNWAAKVLHAWLQTEERFYDFAMGMVSHEQLKMTHFRYGTEDAPSHLQYNEDVDNPEGGYEVWTEGTCLLIRCQPDALGEAAKLHQGLRYAWLMLSGADVYFSEEGDVDSGKTVNTNR